MFREKYKRLSYYEATPRDKKPKSVKSKYGFWKRLDRLQSIEQIPPLFDDPEGIGKRKGRYKEFKGKIAGIEAKIDFREDRSPRVYAHNEKDLVQVYEKIRDVLKGR